MRKKFLVFSKETIDHILTGSLNIFIFLPYFFSVGILFKTLFSPWKRIKSEKTEVGFSASDFFDRLSTDLVSRCIGFFLRIGLLLTYVVVQITYTALVPIVFVVSILLLPIRYLISISKPDEKTLYGEQKRYFVDKHMLDKKNLAPVLAWFDELYKKEQHNPWWSKEALYLMVPLAKDWTSGYTPTLYQFAQDLSVSPLHKDKIVGREEVIDQIELALSKSINSNVILVGENGVGKSMVIQELANKFASGNTLPDLMYKKLYVLDLPQLLASTTDQVQREVLIKQAFEEAKRAGNIVMVIFDFERYVSSEKGKIDLSKVFSEYSQLPDSHLIGVTNPLFYEKYIFPNKELSQICNKIAVPQIDSTTTLEILTDIAHDREHHFGIILPYETLQAIVDRTNSFMSTLPQPQKSLDILDELCTGNQQTGKQLLPSDVDAVVTKKTQVPTSITTDMKSKLLGLEEQLKKRIIKQDPAIEAVASSLRKSFVLTSSSKKPLGSFLFLGPTGVGKTETAKALSSIFFKGDSSLIRFDMALYQSTSDIIKLVGDSSTKEPGLLTQAIREQPYGVLLLDELEKASKDLVDIFLTILDEGYFTSGSGETVDCKNLIIIATSNAGSEYLSANLAKGISLTQNQVIDYLISQQIFRPEFLNRFDGVVVYSPLSPEALLAIADIQLAELSKMIKEKYNIDISISNEYKIALIQQGYDPRFGARNLKRTIQNTIEDTIAKAILSGEAKAGTKMTF